MTTKPLLVSATILVFLAGWAFGFSLGDMRKATKTVPASEREQGLIDAVQTARLSTDSPAENFRVAIGSASRDYVFTLSEAARAVARGGDYTTVTAATDARVAALTVPFGSIIGQVDQGQNIQFWKSTTGAIYNYSIGKAKNDEAGVKTATDNLAILSGKFAELYSGLGAQLSSSALQASYARTMTKLERSIDAANGGTLLTSLQSEQQAAQELGGLMDMVTAGVVKAHPTKF